MPRRGVIVDDDDDDNNDNNDDGGEMSGRVSDGERVGRLAPTTRG